MIVLKSLIKSSILLLFYQNYKTQWLKNNTSLSTSFVLSITKFHLCIVLSQVSMCFCANPVRNFIYSAPRSSQNLGITTIQIKTSIYDLKFCHCSINNSVATTDSNSSASVFLFPVSLSQKPLSVVLFYCWAFRSSLSSTKIVLKSAILFSIS